MSGLDRVGIVAAGRPEELLRGALPFLSVLLLMAIDLAPLPTPAPTALAPLLCLSGIFYWTVHRPDLLGNTLVLIATVVLDATAGLPLGLTALAFFVTRLLLLAPPRFFAGRSFLVLWACYGLAVTVLMILRWLLASLYFQHLFALRPVAFELLLTTAAYPLVSFVMARLHPYLPKVAHAAPRG
jgi:rod shape-determining protein MreD